MIRRVNAIQDDGHDDLERFDECCKLFPGLQSLNVCEVLALLQEEKMEACRYLTGTNGKTTQRSKDSQPEPHLGVVLLLRELKGSIPVLCISFVRVSVTYLPLLLPAGISIVAPRFQQSRRLLRQAPPKEARTSTRPS